MGNRSAKPPTRNSGPARVATGADDDDLDEEVEEARAPGLWASARQGYEEVVKAIIRPPRAEYDVEDLGPKEFQYCGKTFHRSDITLVNKRNLKLQCSHWEPVDSDRPANELPCVIYLHGNSSCRAACLDSLDVAFGIGATMFALDCAGSGQSEGQYVTLGEFEKDDVATVIEYLRGTGRVSTIALWGRSMGAATALLHSHRDPSMACIILDSPFADLRQLANEMVAMGKEQTGIRVPSLLVKAAIKLVQQSVLKRSGLDLNKLKPIEHVDKAFIPALFCHGEDDNFIGVHHSREIYARYAGDKQLVVVPGYHNSGRPPSFQRNAADFLRNAMRIPHEYELVGDPETRLTVPQTWARAHRQVRLATGRWGGDEEDEMIQQAMAASLLLATGGKKSVSQPRPATRTKPAVIPPTVSTDVSAAVGALGPPASVETAARKSSEPGLLEAAESLEVAEPRPAVGSWSLVEDDSDDEYGLLPAGVMYGLSAQLQTPATEWACEACTFVNRPGRAYCEMCNTSAPLVVCAADPPLPPRTPAQSLADPLPPPVADPSASATLSDSSPVVSDNVPQN